MIPEVEKSNNIRRLSGASMDPEQPAPKAAKVYLAMREVMRELGEQGIAKDRKNTQQGFTFRGVDDVYAALNPLLVKYGLLVLPEVLEREASERQTKSGGAIFAVTVKARFQIVSADDGSWHFVTTYGEGMDTADKATSKAMSVAYKYAMFETFCIPVVGMPDSDDDHVETVTSAVIGADKVKELEDEIKATGSDKDKLLALYGAKALTDLTEANYTDAKGKLKRKKNGNGTRQG